MLKIKYHKSFKKDYKRIVKRGYDVSKLDEIIDILAKQSEIPAKYKDHTLICNYEGFRECHISSDWLMIYYIDKVDLILCLTRTGTHSDLF